MGATCLTLILLPRPSPAQDPRVICQLARIYRFGQKRAYACILRITTITTGMPNFSFRVMLQLRCRAADSRFSTHSVEKLTHAKNVNSRLESGRIATNPSRRRTVSTKPSFVNQHG
jgi:hypothetical protein